MAGRPWTEDATRELQSLFIQGSDARSIASRMGRSVDAINQKLQRIRNNGGLEPASVAATIPAEEVQAMATSAGAIRQPQAPVVTSKWIDDEPISEIWERAEATNLRHIDKARERDQFAVDFPADEPIAVAFVSDQHISPGTPVDMARMRADAEYIRDTRNLYALLAGDGIDNHIKHRSAMISMRSSPSDQYKLFEYYLSIFAPKVLAICSGNHDMWTKNFAGVDVLDYITDKQRVCYSPHAYTIRVTVGGQEYTICGRHQYRFNSSMNQTHAVKQLWRFGETDFDIAGVGHHHEHAVEAGVMRGIERWFCRPGSYQISSDYSRQFGYNSTYPTCPTFVLYPRTRDIVGFSDMRKAGQYLRGMLR